MPRTPDENSTISSAAGARAGSVHDLGGGSGCERGTHPGRCGGRRHCGGDDDDGLRSRGGARDGRGRRRRGGRVGSASAGPRRRTSIGRARGDAPGDTVTDGEDAASLLDIRAGGRARDARLEDGGHLGRGCEVDQGDGWRVSSSAPASGKDGVDAPGLAVAYERASAGRCGSRGWEELVSWVGPPSSRRRRVGGRC